MLLVLRRGTMLFPGRSILQGAARLRQAALRALPRAADRTKPGLGRSRLAGTANA